MPPPSSPPRREVWDGLGRAVAIALDVPLAEVRAATRGPARASLARHIACYLAVTTLGWTASEAARICGRDRTTVRHALARIEDRRDCPAFDAMVTTLEDAALGLAGLAGVAERVPGLPMHHGAARQSRRLRASPTDTAQSVAGDRR